MSCDGQSEWNQLASCPPLYVAVCNRWRKGKWNQGHSDQEQSDKRCEWVNVGCVDRFSLSICPPWCAVNRQKVAFNYELEWSDDPETHVYLQSPASRFPSNPCPCSPPAAPPALPLHQPCRLKPILQTCLCHHSPHAHPLKILTASPEEPHRAPSAPALSLQTSFGTPQPLSPQTSPPSCCPTLQDPCSPYLCPCAVSTAPCTPQQPNASPMQPPHPPCRKHAKAAETAAHTRVGESEGRTG